MRGKTLGLAALSLIATGCSDPIEGQWESENRITCGLNRVEHVSVFIEGDGTGYGDVCDCDFTFTWLRLNDDRYRFDIDFRNSASCLFFADGEYDCEIRSNGKLDCDDLGDYIPVD